MTMAANLRSYLERRSLPFETLAHSFTQNSMRTASAAHVPGDRLAKGVVIRVEDTYLLVVVPSDYRVHLGMLHHYLGREVGLATESEVAQLFPDCDPGAVPPLGAAYRIRTLVDERLLRQPEIYFESGDHCNLVKVDGEQFARLVADADWVSVAKHV